MQCPQPWLDGLQPTRKRTRTTQVDVTLPSLSLSELRWQQVVGGILAGFFYDNDDICNVQGRERCFGASKKEHFRVIIWMKKDFGMVEMRFLVHQLLWALIDILHGVSRSLMQIFLLLNTLMNSWLQDCLNEYVKRTGLHDVCLNRDTMQAQLFKFC